VLDAGILLVMILFIVLDVEQNKTSVKISFANNVGKRFIYMQNFALLVGQNKII
jgi:hypothetical protein